MGIGILELIEHTLFTCAIIITAVSISNQWLEARRRNMINSSQLLKILHNRKADLEKIQTDTPTELNYRIDASIATIKKIICIVESMQREEQND